MKRIIGLAVAVAMTASAVPFALAEDSTAVTAYTYETGVYTDYNEENTDKAVLSFYEDGSLVYSAMASWQDGSYSFDVPEQYIDDNARICYVGGGIYDVIIETPSESAVPSESAAPSETSEPSSTGKPEATAAPAKTPHPEVYPKAMDAIDAFAVVKGISQTVIEGEDYYTAEMLYQGSEITANIRASVSIVSASDASSYLIGKDAGALQDGDVIHFTTDLQGRIKSIEFIYRPDFTDYVHSGTECGDNFSLLISASGAVANHSGWTVAAYGGTADGDNEYAFGVPVSARNGELILADKSGNTMDIDLDSRAMVYTVVDTSRGDKSEFSGNGYNAVTTTYVPDDMYDEDGNIISWEEVEDVTYALVRIIDGTATDVVVFTER